MARTMQIHESDKTSGTAKRIGVKFSLNLRAIEIGWTKVFCCQWSLVFSFLFLICEKGQMWNISRVVGCAFDWRVKPTELLLNLHSMERKANLPYFKFLSPQPLEQFPKSSPHFLPKLRSASGVQHWHLRSKLRWVGGPSIDIIWWGGKYKRTLFSHLRKGAIWNPGLATITCHFSHFVPAISL